VFQGKVPSAFRKTGLHDKNSPPPVHDSHAHPERGVLDGALDGALVGALDGALDDAPVGEMLGALDGELLGA